jgi:hypothetical protein
MISESFDHPLARDRVVLASICGLLTGGSQNFNTNFGNTVVLKQPMSYEVAPGLLDNSSSQLL